MIFMEQHTLSPLQDKILEIFKEVKAILDRHHLRYFALGGTCIGAVRHRGFIPWDDDLDIVLPDKDYYRFLELAPKELPPYMALYLSYEQRHRSSLEAKVHDMRTTFIEEAEINHPEDYKGVFIDIFRMGGTPEDAKERAAFCRRFRNYKRLNEKRRTDFCHMQQFRSKLLWVAALPLRVLPYNFWSDKIMRMTDRYPYDEHSYVALTWEAKMEKRLEKREEIYGETIELPFEDTTIACPANYDKFLRDIFGDYMQLPPEEERVGLHITDGVIDLEKPYAYYQEQFRCNGTIKKEPV